MSETELSITPKKDEIEEQPKRRGRPRTVNITDKTEYHKNYYDNNRETLSEQKKQYYLENKEQILEYQKEYQKGYIEKLKINEPEKFKELRQKQKELSSDAHKKERDAYKLLKTLIKEGIIILPESHKNKILELMN